MTIYPAKKTKIALLLAKKVIVPAEYLGFVNVFLDKLANILSKQIRANEHAIKLKQGKQSPYWPLYNLGSVVKFETLKFYVETNLANGFIKASKSPVGALILFVCNFNSSFYLCVDYQEANNLTIQNRYLLFLIEESLN